MFVVQKVIRYTDGVVQIERVRTAGKRMMIWSETETGRGSITVTVPDRTALLNDLSRRLDEGKGFSVATLNLDHAVSCQALQGLP